ncbi:hypothetical protein [Bosea sp. ANAM02]|uniref:hypothetical protein n=1 Tax=Bosea sp. ANAM02 TaxID=2020412 RepID=UPI0015630549|nr:hypothetical protein [Bosea sp. ANAM02]
MNHQIPALSTTADADTIATTPTERLASLVARLEDEALGLLGRDPASYDRDAAEARIEQLGEEIRSVMSASTPPPAAEQAARSAPGLPHPNPHLAFSIANAVLNAIAWGEGAPEALDRSKALAEAAAEMATQPRRAVNWLTARAALHEIDAAVRAARRSE